MIIYSVMVVLALDGGRGGELYVVEDEEIGKMGGNGPFGAVS
jgi:hypothetical protein